MDIGFRHQLITFDATAGEERDLRCNADRPVRPEIPGLRKPIQRERHFSVLRRQGKRRKSLRFGNSQKSALCIDGFGGLPHRRSIDRSRVGTDSDVLERRIRRRRIIDRSRQLHRSIERNVEQLLQSQVSNFTIALALDHDRPLVCARHLCAEKLELRDIPNCAREARLPQHVLGLNRR